MAETQKGSTGKRANAKDDKELIPSGLLTKDHEVVLKMFEDYEKLKDSESSKKQELAKTICAELQVHTQIEEEIYYPRLRKLANKDSLLNEAEVEHASAAALIKQISTMSPEDRLFDAKVKVLGEYVKHHIKEEQKEMFPLAKKAGLDTPEIAEELMERKEELQRKLH